MNDVHRYTKRFDRARRTPTVERQPLNLQIHRWLHHNTRRLPPVYLLLLVLFLFHGGDRPVARVILRRRRIQSLGKHAHQQKQPQSARCYETKHHELVQRPAIASSSPPNGSGQVKRVATLVCVKDNGKRRRAKHRFQKKKKSNEKAWFLN